MLLSTEFAINKSHEGAAAMLELHGELDLAVAARLSAEFPGLLASDPAVVIVDLRDLSFMDARGLRALIDLRTSCSEQARRFVLVRGQRRVHRMLVLCNLARTFEFVDSAAEALELTRAGDGSLDEPGLLRSRAALGFPAPWAPDGHTHRRRSESRDASAPGSDRRKRPVRPLAGPPRPKRP